MPDKLVILGFVNRAGLASADSDPGTPEPECQVLQYLRQLAAYCHRLLQDRGGATAIEYGLICALIFVAIVIAVGWLGQGAVNNFNDIGSEIDAALT